MWLIDVNVDDVASSPMLLLRNDHALQEVRRKALSPGMLSAVHAPAPKTGTESITVSDRLLSGSSSSLQKE